MRVVIARVHENMFAGEALSLSVPTTSGDVVILPHHEPYVATLKRGTVTVVDASGPHTFSVESGVLEVSNNQATVLL